MMFPGGLTKEPIISRELCVTYLEDIGYLWCIGGDEAGYQPYQNVWEWVAIRKLDLGD